MAAIIETTESKLGHTVPDLKVNLPGYDVLRCDRNRNGVVVACYIRKNLCCNTRALNCKEIENIIFGILLSYFILRKQLLQSNLLIQPPL